MGFEFRQTMTVEEVQKLVDEQLIAESLRTSPRNARNKFEGRPTMSVKQTQKMLDEQIIRKSLMKSGCKTKRDNCAGAHMYSVADIATNLHPVVRTAQCSEESDMLSANAGRTRKTTCHELQGDGHGLKAKMLRCFKLPRLVGLKVHPSLPSDL